MEVYAVGNEAAIVIAPLDRDECLARRRQPSPIAGRGVAGNYHVTELITQYTSRSVPAI